jgi:hypothetical protein
MTGRGARLPNPPLTHARRGGLCSAHVRPLLVSLPVHVGTAALACLLQLAALPAGADLNAPYPGRA